MRRYLIAKKRKPSCKFYYRIGCFFYDGSGSRYVYYYFGFSGLEDLNKDFISNLHADLTLKSTQGKVIPNIQKVTSTLKSEKRNQSFSKMIEEKSLHRLQKHGRNCLHKRRRLGLCKSESY